MIISSAQCFAHEASVGLSWQLDIPVVFVLFKRSSSNSGKQEHVERAHSVTRAESHEKQLNTSHHLKGLLQPLSSNAICFLVPLCCCGSTMQKCSKRPNVLCVAWIIPVCSPHLSWLCSKPAPSGSVTP